MLLRVKEMMNLNINLKKLNVMKYLVITEDNHGHDYIFAEFENKSEAKKCFDDLKAFEDSYCRYESVDENDNNDTIESYFPED